jgi:hypothetical protein
MALQVLRAAKAFRVTSAQPVHKAFKVFREFRV